MLAGVVRAGNFEELMKDIRNSENADIIELRLDYFKNFDSKSKFLNNALSAVKNSRRPIIITNRKKTEGGFFDGDENKRIEILKNAVEIGVDYVDIELSSDKSSIKELINNKKTAKIIVSYHNFSETPDDIKEVYKNIKKLNPDLIKIATYANSALDNFKIFDLIKTANKEKRKIITFCMGSYGQFSRILSIVLGTEVAYASVEDGKESADGQLTIDEMSRVYRIKELNKDTKIAGLIGNPVEHSCSHIIHNAAFGSLGINAVYLKFRVDKLKEFISYFKELNTLGFSVTIPYKIEVMQYLDKIDKKAEAIGAVNTIVIKNKKLIGYNTDCGGAIKALKTKTELQNKKVVILGAGGSSRALSYGLLENKADVTILNRTNLKDLKHIDYDILVNTTPVGMHPDVGNCPINPSLIKGNTVVFDIVFNPYKTKLLQYAEKKGCVIIPGFEMLVNGAALQFKLWTEKPAPEHLMIKRVMNELKWKI